MVRFDRVSKRYPSGKEALSGVSFELDHGEMAFLTGHSGAGKSTLLKLMMRMEVPTRGEVVVDGSNLSRLREGLVPYHRRKVGVVFQNHQLLFDRSVFDNVALPLLISGTSLKETGRRVRAALDKVGLLGKEKLNPIQLSGGEQQRIGIARAVVNKPALLIADEPTGNLDSHTADEIQKLIRELNQQLNTSFVVVTHDMSFASQAQKSYKLGDGKLLELEGHGNH